MPAPLYGADDAPPLFRQFRIGRCWINSEKLRSDNVATAGNERGWEFRHRLCTEKEERELKIYQTSIRPFR